MVKSLRRLVIGATLLALGLLFVPILVILYLITGL